MTTERPSALPFSPATALAPLEGIGRPTVLRAWAAIGGMGLLCAPFVRVSSRADQPWPLPLMDALCQKFGPMEQSVQLLGADPPRMAMAARALVERGIRIVDLNFGCPSRAIVRKGAGAALLADPPALRAIVRAVRDAIDVPLIAKIRLGVERPEEAFALVAAAADGGADAVAVHARTLKDGYRPPARWDSLARVVAASPVPVIGNGDVWTAADALRLRAETGCAGVMVGRGALRNPWIFQQIEALSRGVAAPPTTLADVHGFLRPLADALFAEAAGQQARMGPVKEIVAHMGLLLTDGGAWRRETLRTKEPEALLARIDALLGLTGVAILEGPPQERPPSLP